MKDLELIVFGDEPSQDYIDACYKDSDRLINGMSLKKVSFDGDKLEVNHIDPKDIYLDRPVSELNKTPIAEAMENIHG